MKKLTEKQKSHIKYMDRLKTESIEFIRNNPTNINKFKDIKFI